MRTSTPGARISPLRPRSRADHEGSRLGTHHQHQRVGFSIERLGGRIHSQRWSLRSTKNLADELGPHGINAVVIHPGGTRTEATPGIAAARAEERGVSVEHDS